MRRKEQFTMLSFENRYIYQGIIQKTTFDNLYNAFKNNYIRTKETVLEYQKGDKTFRDKCKDKGGFIMGESINNKREKTSILKRNMITLDLDYCDKNILQVLEEKVILGELDFRFFVYSTHSHTTEAPRLRMIIPLDKDITPEEYQAVSSKICQKVGIQYFDATTTQPNRIMYFPSVSVDGDYVCELYGEQLDDLNSEKILSEFLDWKNISEWQRPHYFEKQKKERFEKGTIKDSTKTKYRLVNCFNIEYSITEAIDFFLQDVYEKESDFRYSFIQGETKNGLNILNNQYAFSFHGTDPAQGRLLNAFDIVRIHKFGKYDTDNEQKVDDQFETSQSYQKMCDWILKELPNVVNHSPNIQEQKAKIQEKAEKIGMAVVPSIDWTDKFIRDKNGNIKKMPYNISVIIENDVVFKDLFFYDIIKQQICFERPPYWDKEIKKGDGIRDFDFSFIRNYVSQPPYELTGEKAIEDAVFIQAYKKRVNYAKWFLTQLPEWDGKKRAETLFIKLFGVEDCAFIREASKKWLTALIARIIKPGCKFDYTIALLGSVGIGKSTFGKTLICHDWNGKTVDIENYNYFFSDKEIDLRNERDTIDAIRGICVLELPEFDKFLNKYDKATLKSFMTKSKDRFIERYGKRSIDVPRSFVMLATSNETKPIKNPDDERRFMPFYCTLPKHKALVFDEKMWNKEIRDQVLAEALYYYNEGYAFSAPFEPKLQQQWDTLIEKASLENDYYGLVKDYVENRFPINFFTYTFEEMKDFWRATPNDREMRLRRTEFSVKEIYCLALDKKIGDKMDFLIRQEIEQSLRKLGFEKVESKRKSFGVLGQQYYYELKELSIEDYKNKPLEEIEEKIESLKKKDKESGLNDNETKLLKDLEDLWFPF